jgi:hypothetical protein
MRTGNENEKKYSPFHNKKLRQTRAGDGKGTFHVAQRSAGELNALPGGGDAVDWAATGSERVDWC